MKKNNKYITVRLKAFRADIHIAGDIKAITTICRKFCFENPLCVNIIEQDFCYNGGLEKGVKVGLINYPKHPRKTYEIRRLAVDLAFILIEEGNQWSALVEDTEKTQWITRRPEDFTKFQNVTTDVQREIRE